MGTRDLDPIVICGPRRSGTTLMLAVLCSDPRAHPPQPEAQILTRIVEAYDWSAENFATFGRPYFSDESSLRALYSDACAQFMNVARSELAPGGLLVLKHPALMRVLDRFQQLVPAARVVTMLRDPRDQVASELEVAGRGSRGSRRVIEWSTRRVGWSVRVRARNLMSWFENAAGVADTVIVRYEDLVLDFEAVSTRLELELDVKIGFDPTRAWHDISGLEAFRTLPSWSARYGRPVDPSSVGRFRRELAASEIAVVEDICGEIMTRFGYTREAVTS